MPLDHPTLTDAALAYAEAGIPVFPLAGKVPRIARRDGGRGCLDATTDRAVVAGWWRRWPDANVGIATGEAAGYFVVDVDGPEGHATLAELEATWGPLPATRSVATGGGGRHLFFRYPDEARIGNSAGTKLGRGLDTRGAGGYVVAPPSCHPVTGACYAWETSPTATIAAPPAWLLDLIASQPVPPPCVDLGLEPGAREQKYGLKALAAEAAELAATGEGRRNSRLNLASMRIGQLAAACDISEATAAAALLQAARACGLEAGESRATFSSGWRKGLRTPRGVPNGQRHLASPLEGTAVRLQEPAAAPIDLVEFKAARCWLDATQPHRWPPAPAGVPANEPEMLANYVVLVGTEKVWDRRRGCMVTPAALKLAHGRMYRPWSENERRLMIDVDRLVFKPEGELPGELNLFTGLPELQVYDRSGVDAWFEHAANIAGPNAPWLIGRLAYKLQNLGAKVASSIVIHGEQGTGKNLFFAPLLAIYGRYGAIVGQQQVESPYTDWLSGKLLLVADEVASRGERYQVKNKLKGLITGETLAINEKFASTRWERNCADLHFLSNEEVPLVVEPGDRRFCVLRVDAIYGPDYYAALASVDPGALGEALLAWDCGAFNPHARPPETVAKRALLELTQEPSDRFLDAWLAGDLPIPVVGASAHDLYQAYTIWSKTHGEQRVIQSAIAFGRLVGKRLRSWVIRDGDRTLKAWSHNGDRPTPAGCEAFRAASLRWLDLAQKGRL